MKAGSRVICLFPTDAGNIKKGEIYTVKWAGIVPAGPAVLLNEVSPSAGFYAFNIWRFREIEWVENLLESIVSESVQEVLID